MPFGFGFGRRVRRHRDGTFELRLPDEERQVLRSLPDQLRALLSAPDSESDQSLERLFPPAYLDDDEREAEFRRLMRADLLERKQATLSLMESTIDKPRLTEDELAAWLGALNDLRLVLGTQLDVSDDPSYSVPDDSPSAGAFAVYSYLGWLQEHVVSALDPEYGSR